MVQLTATFNILRIAKYCPRNGEEKKKETKKFTNSIPVEITKKKEKKKRYSRPVWYMCLKTKNCCLKIFVEIRVS